MPPLCLLGSLSRPGLGLWLPSPTQGGVGHRHAGPTCSPRKRGCPWSSPAGGPRGGLPSWAASGPQPLCVSRLTCLAEPTSGAGKPRSKVGGGPPQVAPRVRTSPAAGAVGRPARSPGTRKRLRGRPLLGPEPGDHAFPGWLRPVASDHTPQTGPVTFPVAAVTPQIKAMKDGGRSRTRSQNRCRKEACSQQLSATQPAAGAASRGHVPDPNRPPSDTGERRRKSAVTRPLSTPSSASGLWCWRTWPLSPDSAPWA